MSEDSEKNQAEPEIEQVSYEFLRSAGRILNSGQARALLITGAVHDLFQVGETVDQWVPLTDFFRRHWNVPGKILLVYELNGPIRFADDEDREKLKRAFVHWRTGMDSDDLAIQSMLDGKKFDQELATLEKTFDRNLQNAVGNPTVAMELLRQLCSSSRYVAEDGKAALDEDLIVLIEGTDLMVPEGTVTSISDADRRRLAICTDWFSDPGFLKSRDAVVLLAESRSLLNHRVARLPQILEVEIPSPGIQARSALIHTFLAENSEVELHQEPAALAELTAGLSIHALLQLLKGAAYGSEGLNRDDVVAKVESYVQSQLGDDVVEIKKPSHGLDKVVGFEDLKAFLAEELIPRFQTSGPGALPGAAVAGPIGGGKTFIFEAVATELDMVVVVLKNLRSQWFGQTDVIFERLRRVLQALSKVVIFVDEADTQFGGIGPGTHSTERRLTGKIQQMMSDPALRGRVFWLLMTARIHHLSPDIRRPGRVGDLIIPVLDPDGADRDAFLSWVLSAVLAQEPTDEEIGTLGDVTEGYSAAAFAALRGRLKAAAQWLPRPEEEGEAHEDPTLTLEQVLDVAADLIPPAIGETRRYQTLQALLNCTRRRLLPEPDMPLTRRDEWAEEIRRLETQGIS